MYLFAMDDFSGKNQFWPLKRLSDSILIQRRPADCMRSYGRTNFHCALDHTDKHKGGRSHNMHCDYLQ